MRCFDFRLDFELRMCEKTEKRPYVCTCCTYDRDGCELPKCRYSVTEAHLTAQLHASTDCQVHSRVRGFLPPDPISGQPKSWLRSAPDRYTPPASAPAPRQSAGPSSERQRCSQSHPGNDPQSAPPAQNPTNYATPNGLPSE